jgi:hypothetical protein
MLAGAEELAHETKQVELALVMPCDSVVLALNGCVGRAGCRSPFYRGHNHMVLMEWIKLRQRRGAAAG